MRSLYIHFPFCEVKCHYCDFYSLGRSRTKEGDSALFEAALKKEVTQSAHRLAPELDTVFLGGGTPSMTHYDSMAASLEPLWKHTSITPQTEWTMEANPSSVSLPALKAYRSLGINRISFGVQALRPDLLEKLGRVHSREEALTALGNAFEAGFQSVSADLLCGVPDQSVTDLEQALDLLLQFPLNHLSCYLLTLPPHHKMFRDLPGEDTQLEHLLFVDRYMKSRGFSHYEVSNYALPGKEARHNLAYWKGSSYLGIGPSAHSYDADLRKRWKNVSSLHKYAQLLEKGESPIDSVEELTTEQIALERWMLALRLNEGFPETWLLTPNQKARVHLFEGKGFLERHPSIESHWRLTATGFALSDQVIRSLA